MKPLPIHPYCDLLPDMSDDEWSEFCKSMQFGFDANHPILEYAGQVIDGKNRQRAALLVGVTPIYKIWKPISNDKAEIEREILALVKRENFDRRQLTVGQRASAAAKFATLQNGQRPPSGIQLGGEKPEKIAKKTQVEAAREFKVSVASVKEAKAIHEKATPEVIAAVDRGDMSLNAAKNTIPSEMLKNTPVAKTSPRKTDAGPDHAFDAAEQKAWRAAYGTLIRMGDKWLSIKGSTEADNRKQHAELFDELGAVLKRWKKMNPTGAWV